MTEYVKCTAEQLGNRIARDLERLRGRLTTAVNRTAEDAVGVIRKRTPRAFGDLAGSVHAVTGAETKTVVDAPHAGSVEIGSAPHTPDIKKLIEWVKLRGMQALSVTTRRLRRMGPTTSDQATRIHDLLHAEISRGSGGDFSPLDAPERVALAIARGIEKHGTRPHWFVRESLPEIAQTLDKRIRRALKK